MISSTICAGVAGLCRGCQALGVAPRAAVRLPDVAIGSRTTPAVPCHGNSGEAGQEEPWTSAARSRVLFTEVQEASGGAMAWLPCCRPGRCRRKEWSRCVDAVDAVHVVLCLGYRASLLGGAFERPPQPWWQPPVAHDEGCRERDVA